MKKFVLVCLATLLAPATAAFAAPADAAAATPVVGNMLYSADGKKLAPVYKLDSSGAPQVLIDGQLLTVPVSTLSAVNGHVETSLTKRDLLTGS